MKQPTKRTRGLGFVHQRKNSSMWWVQYFVRGKRFRESSGSTNRADAVRLLKQRIADAQSGRPVGPQAEKTTLAQLAQMLADDYQVNGRRSLKRIKGALKHLLTFFGDELAVNVTTDRVLAYVAHRREEGAAAATTNRELAALKRAFRLGQEAGKVIQRPKVSLLRENNRRRGSLSVRSSRPSLRGCRTS